MEAVKMELMGLFRDQLDAMLVEIAKDHDLDLEELQAKYEVFTATPAPPKATKAPRARKAKSDSDGEGERKKCSATTAKGAACKNFALAGGSFCACHNKGKTTKPTKSLRSKAAKGGVKPVDPPSSDSESEAPKRARKPVKVEIESESETEEESVKSPVKQKRPGKKAPVVHKHEMDEEVHSDCEACEVIGNVMAATEDEKVVVPPEVMKELDALFESDGEEDAEDDEDAESLSEIDD